MSKTDGIGTWVWNDGPLSIPDTGTYNFDFTSNSVSYSSIRFSSRLGRTDMDYVSTLAYRYDGDFVQWFNDAYKTIEITSAPPAEFMTILTANATYQEPVSDKYKLYINEQLAEINGMNKGIVVYQGVEYEFDNGSAAPTDELLGTWVFKQEITIPTGDTKMAYSLDTAATQYFKFKFTSTILAQEQDCIGILFGSSNFGAEPWVYTAKGWDDVHSATITITDTSTLTNRDEFTTWLKANAVKQ